MQREYDHLFGPVPSRRFGSSLGVDLTTFKTCTLDCVFCQLGRTTCKTLERKEYVAVNDVTRELDDWFRNDGQADVVTLSGSGEPTLHSGFGDVLACIGARNPSPTVLLSNGTLFWIPSVREAAMHADIVKLSLSAWDQASFRQVNRPHEDLDFDRIVEGQRTFRRMFGGQLWLEIFLVRGMNSTRRDVEKIAELVKTVAPDETHLNTAVRPPAEGFVEPLPRAAMEELTTLFDPPATVIAEFPADRAPAVDANEKTIVDMLSRRPCTARQVAAAFGMHVNEVAKYLGKLTREGCIHARRKGGETYYTGRQEA